VLKSHGVSFYVGHTVKCDIIHCIKPATYTPTYTRRLS